MRSSPACFAKPNPELPTMTTPTENELRLIEQGRPALEKFLSRWRAGRSLGIVAVIREARAAEQKTGVGDLQAEADRLRAKRDAATGDPGKFVSFERDYVAACRRVAEAAPFAHSEGARVWRNPASLKAILADLRALRDAVEVELDRIVSAQVAFSIESGCGALDPEAVREISPAWQALNEFLHRHLAPLLGTAEGTGDDGGSNPHWDASSASWVLLGCGWRTVDPGKGLLAKVADAIAGTKAKPSPAAAVAPVAATV
jgi:hypothetical protein